MSLATRRILYIIFIFLFLTITPPIILYAAGYKFSSRDINFQKTGMFILDSRPSGAKIYINGKVQQTFFEKIFADKKSYTKTPAKIKNLLPGEYDLKIELEGYWEWQKKLKIYPGSSTYAEDIYLFKKNLPVLLSPGSIKNLALSPDKNRLAILSENKLTLIDLDDENQNTVETPVSEQIKISWSADGKKIIANEAIYYTDDLSNFSQDNFSNPKWIDNDLYYQSQDNLFNLNSLTRLEKKITEEQEFTDYLIKNEYIYLINDLNNSINLRIFEKSGQFIKGVSLPGSKNHYFVNPENHLLNIYDEEHQILYLVDPVLSFYSPIKEVINNIKYFQWINGNRLLYANDFEIWLFDLGNRKKTLLTRISQDIKNVLFHPSNNYVLYATDQSINTIELDEREKRNITELIKLDKISFPVISQKGDMLYFYAKIGNREGLYKLFIQ